MEIQATLISNLNQYLSVYSNENERLDPFRNFLINSNATEIFNRKNFNGHITASAIIIDNQNRELLVIKHKTLDRWLQPGGHVDASDKSILSAALREINEEVNIHKTDLKLISPFNLSDVPFDIDSHLIPRNNQKKELPHYHHDFKYLFIYQGDKHISINENEATSYKWITFDKVENDSAFSRIIKKTKALINKPITENQSN